MPFNVSGCVSITNVHKPYLSIILKIRKLRHRGLNALPKVKDLVSGRARSHTKQWGSITHSIILPFQLLLNIRYFDLPKPLNDSLIHAIIGCINERRRMKGDSLLPQSLFPEELLLYLMLQDSHGSPQPDFLLLETLLCYFCIPATRVLCMSLFGSLSYLQAAIDIH